MSKARLDTDDAEGAADAALLTRLGERVRGMRARRGMTRKMLSAQSGVSERYIAEMESGRGNISVLRLSRIAGAFGVTLSDFFRDRMEERPEAALVADLLHRLPPEEVRAIYREIASRQGLGPDRRGRVALVGLRGAGKTTLGQLLAKARNVPFVRLVSEMERLAGMDVDAILALQGQPSYRRLEYEALAHTLETHDRVVIEAGGSLVSETRTLNLLLGSCVTLWVRARPEDHMNRVMAQGDFRPMADNREAMSDLKRILDERRPFYEQSDAVLDTSGKTVEEARDALEDLCASYAPLL